MRRLDRLQGPAKAFPLGLLLFANFVSVEAQPTHNSLPAVNVPSGVVKPQKKGCSPVQAIPLGVYTAREAERLPCDGKDTAPLTGPNKIGPDQDSSIGTGSETKDSFHWGSAVAQSGIFLGTQHAFRMFQSKTRREIGGPFFSDWKKSVASLHGWRDGDNSFTNYVAHPLQGALTGRIFVNNSNLAKRQEFGGSKAYWRSRLKAATWAAAWSAQFELGPVSEASIGNVGMRKRNGYGTMGYVDLVITPVVGTAVLVTEDAIDRYILKNWIERITRSKTTIQLIRMFLTPTTSISNILRRKMPWKRDERPL